MENDVDFWIMNYPVTTAVIDVLDVDLHNIGPAPDYIQLWKEIESLKSNSTILSTYSYTLIVCDLCECPALRQELGRQREITFRQAGESTGLPLDIDRYDDYYDQLIIWDHNANRLVGGYRFGSGNKIYSTYGREGFYINSLFEIAPEFDEYLPKCLELGRSFIVKDYQRKTLPLYLLWKGILAYQLRNPQFQYLMGSVSISRVYSDFSKQVLMEYAGKHFFHKEFAKWFRPRIPFDPALSQEDRSSVVTEGKTENLSQIIDTIRPEHIRFPILMKQYIRQNARFLGFNLDPQFNDALDGLMILDIADVPDETMQLLQREMI